jgi:hypothetical protein
VRFFFVQSKVYRAAIMLLFAALACNFPTKQPTSTPPPTRLPPTVTPLPTIVLPTAEPGVPYVDVNALFAGVCFNFLQTLADQTVVIDSERDLAAFYSRVDRSRQCIEPVARHTFDFSSQQIVGTAVIGTGCRISLNYEHVEEGGQRRQIVFRRLVDGDCPYQLVRPLWLAITRPAQGGSTQIVFGP